MASVVDIRSSRGGGTLSVADCALLLVLPLLLLLVLLLLLLLLCWDFGVRGPPYGGTKSHSSVVERHLGIMFVSMTDVVEQG